MEVLERIVVGIIFGLPGFAIIGYNYYRIFSKKATSSPAYLIGGILGAVGVLSILGDAYRSRWYFILIPIVLDWGLFAVSLIWALIGEPVKPEDKDAKDKRI